MQKIKGILFDKDGTVVNFEQTWVPTYQAAALSLTKGDPELANNILSASGLSADNISFIAGSVLAAGTIDEISELWHSYLPNYSIGTLTNELNRLLEEGAVTNAIEITDTEAFFLRLSKLNLKLGIATNDSESSAVQTMGSLLGATNIDFIAGCDSGYGGKPGPGMFIAFCEAVNLDPRDVAVVGDNIQDLEMGRRGGAGKLIGVLSGNASAIELKSRADYIIKNITFLEVLLNDL